MSDFGFPTAQRHRVIIDTDAKNEADDQFAIVHALLTPAFEIHGIIPAHFGLHAGRPAESMEASQAEVERLLRLMHLDGKVPVAPGARRALPDERTPQPSAGARLIIAEAMRADPRPLHVLCFGPLTDPASALLLEPRLAERSVHIIWVGGAEGPTHYGPEFNLSNDVPAANLLLRSGLAFTQIPYPLYGHFCVSYAELFEKVHPQGALGRYLVEQLVAYNAASSAMAREYRSLGDSAAVGVLLAPHAGRWQSRPAPRYDPATLLPERAGTTARPVREYETFDARFLLEDFFAKLARFARHEGTGDPKPGP
ncbi:MAG: nucleoside hydrolase [Verrucomicrobia bacterium]|nr:nucleoside hydrolase [Verrucomicrobiota bacterium]